MPARCFSYQETAENTTSRDVCLGSRVYMMSITAENTTKGKGKCNSKAKKWASVACIDVVSISNQANDTGCAWNQLNSQQLIIII